MGKGSTTQSSKVSPWIPKTKHFNKFTSRAKKNITKPFAASLNEARADLRNMSGNAGLNPAVKASLLDMMRGGDAGAAAQMKQRVISDIMPSINSTFAGSGMTGSSLHQQNLAKGVSEGVAGVEQQIQDRALQAAGTLSNAEGQEFQRLLALVQGKQDLGSKYQDAFQGALGTWLGAASGNSSSTTTESSSPGLGGLIGAGLQVASLFSDERLKTDKKRVGKMDDGTPIYTYRYKDGVAPEFEGKTLMGIMAGDAKKKAVVEDPSGFKRVNYGAL